MAMRDFFRNDRDDERDRWAHRDERRFAGQNEYGGGREFGQSEGRRGASPGSRDDWRGSSGREGRGYEQFGNQGGAHGTQGAEDQDRDRFGGSGGYGGGQGYGSQEGSYGSGRGGTGGEPGVGTRHGSGQGQGQGQGHGQHRGRGPRGYQRSDERIREEICETLSDDGWLDASDVDVLVREGEVTLTGHVTSRQDKRRAVDLIENLSGVKDVHNNLRVGGESAGAAGVTQGAAQIPVNPRH